MKKIALLSFVMCLPVILFSQSFMYTPMQTSFENESFFYHPVQMAPSNIGPLSQLLPGFRSSTDPLNQLAQNPAWLPHLNGHNLYAYVNVQSRNMYRTELPNRYCCIIDNNRPAIDLPYYFIPYNDPYANADGHRLNQEPFLSAAFIGYPFADKHIFAGITYQGIISKEDYYGYPSNSYPQSSLNSDFAATGATNPTQFFQQKNTLKQTGHFLSLLGGYHISDRVSLGLQIEAALFQRNGGFGSNPTYYSSGGPVVGISPQVSLDASFTQLNLFTEQRSQHYRHLSFDLGGRYVVNPKLTGMAHFGYLIGSGDENLDSTSPFFNEDGTINSGSYYNLNQRVTTSLMNWDNSGHAFIGGLAFQLNLPENGRISFFYEGYTNYTGLSPSAQVQTASYIDQQIPNYNPFETITSSQSSELHSGSGSEHTWIHRFGLFYRWFSTQSLTLNIGIQSDYNLRNIHTQEASDITGLTLIQTIDTTGQTATSRQPISGRQELDWHNRIREHTFQIPFIAQVHLFNRIEVWGGFNEKIESIREKDNINPNPVYYYPLETANTSNTNTIGDPVQYMKYHFTRYRFTLLAGVNFDITNRLILHLSALPLDHRYSYDTTNQTLGLIWQAGLSFYP